MATGQIKRLVRDRGFGFIQPTGESADLFFHRTSLADGVFEDLVEGQKVEFEKEADPRDARRTQAAKVRVVS